MQRWRPMREADCASVRSYTPRRGLGLRRITERWRRETWRGSSKKGVVRWGAMTTHNGSGEGGAVLSAQGAAPRPRRAPRHTNGGGRAAR
jgi:hypothetical protein